MIEARGIRRTYHTRSLLGTEVVQALRGVDFTLPEGGAVSFIGESGCGKTTLGKILTGLETYDSGTLVIDGVDVARIRGRKRTRLFQKIQMIHQDPYSALNPTRTIRQILGDPLRMHARETRKPSGWVEQRSQELLSLVGLDGDTVLPKYPHTLSGGQRQRIVIARALTVDPQVLVADEAVSMIDVSMRLGILTLLRDLRRDLGISLMFITHDVATARYVGEGGELHVIYRGEVIERGPTDVVITEPVHPYTQCLLSAVPVLHGIEREGEDRLIPLAMLDERTRTDGCLFAPRCPFAQDNCHVEHPTLTSIGDGTQQHACLYPRVRHVVATEV
ncbi:MAG TPA: ABC transporter ATP-binding protein [Micromonosporaceae bacterium]